MKNKISKPTLLALSLLLLTFAGLVSCKKDKHEPTLRAQLAGEWEIKSFTVDGLEMMGFVLNSSNLEFEAITGSEGDYEWSFDYTDGSSFDASGVYEVDEEDEELVFDSNSGYEAKYDIDLDGDELELSGIVDSSRYELRAERE